MGAERWRPMDEGGEKGGGRKGLRINGAENAENLEAGLEIEEALLWVLSWVLFDSLREATKRWNGSLR